MQTINPATGEVLKEYKAYQKKQIDAAIHRAQTCFNAWKMQPFEKRAPLMRKAGEILLRRKEELARRELSRHGILEFVNAKTVSIA